MLDQVREGIDLWVAEVLSDHPIAKIRDAKIVGDPIHGFIRLQPHEVAVLDSPLLQRLRFIHQTDLAFYVFPGMRHTRFEHSLGVFHVAGQMADALELRHPGALAPDKKAMIRLAGLLHDVGHVFFAHLGEEFLSHRFSEIVSALGEAQVDGISGLFRDANIGEVLSYLIITSRHFRQFLDEAFTANPPRLQGVDLGELDVTDMAKMVIGRTDDDRDHFMAGIINGSVDADKLDYLLRDCHYSGIRAEVDVPRLIVTLSLIEAEGWPRALSIDAIGVHHTEQILLAKLMLFSSLYHHHKIRGIECLARAIYERIIAAPDQIRRNVLRLEKISDFLRLDDFQFISFAGEEPLLANLVTRIRNRDLFKRSLVISRASVTPATRHGLAYLSDVSKSLPQARRLREAIRDRLPHPAGTDVGLLWIDVPRPPEVDRESSQFFVKTGELEPTTLKDILPTPDWLRTYAANKARAHVFCSADEDTRNQVADAAAGVLKEEYGIDLTPYSRLAAHLA